MKIYRNDTFAFEMEVPDEWTLPMGSAHYFMNESLVFGCQYYEAFNIMIGPLPQPVSLEGTEDDFTRYAHAQGFTSLAFGRIATGAGEHVWARYYLGRGVWHKKYLVRPGGIEFDFTATCYYDSMLAQREQVWDQVVRSFYRLQPPASLAVEEATPQPRPSIALPVSPPVLPSTPAPVAPPVQAPLPLVQPSAGTLAFSMVSYFLIAVLGLLYIQDKVGLGALFTMSTQPQSSLVLLALFFTTGAVICFIFLLGIASSGPRLSTASPFLQLVEHTMSGAERPNKTIGSWIFSDYSRRQRRLTEALVLQCTSLLHALIKLISLPFHVALLHPLVSLALLAFWAVPALLRVSLPLPVYTLYFALFLFLCYRAFLFSTSKQKGLSAAGAYEVKLPPISGPAPASTIRSEPVDAVTPELIEKVLCNNDVIAAIKNDLQRIRLIGAKETWRLGLITPDQDVYDLRFGQMSRSERLQQVSNLNVRGTFTHQIYYKRFAVIHSTSYFNTRLNNVQITNGAVKHLNYPLWSYRLQQKSAPGEFIAIRDLEIARDASFMDDRAYSLPEFLREDGFPLKRSYPDGDPLTTDRGGTIVLDRGELKIIYPPYFVQRRLIDDEGSLLDIGIDEDFGHSVPSVSLIPAVSKRLYQYVQSSRYLPVLRYCSVPYASDFMFPVLDTPMSSSGWADLYIDTRGKARLFMARKNTDAQWYEMMDRLKSLFLTTLSAVDCHLLGLTKDKARLEQYLTEKQAILRDYFIIQDWKL